MQTVYRWYTSPPEVVWESIWFSLAAQLLMMCMQSRLVSVVRVISRQYTVCMVTWPPLDDATDTADLPYFPANTHIKHADRAALFPCTHQKLHLQQLLTLPAVLAAIADNSCLYAASQCTTCCWKLTKWSYIVGESYCLQIDIDCIPNCYREAHPASHATAAAQHLMCFPEEV